MKVAIFNNKPQSIAEMTFSNITAYGKNQCQNVVTCNEIRKSSGTV